MTATQASKRAGTQQERRQRAAQRALARSAIYRLLSQALTYPTADGLSALQDVDLLTAAASAASLQDELPALLEQLARRLRRASAAALREEHRSVFPHVESHDCPSHETAYTAQNIFQETQELSDLSGFFRAFGLELAERERPDHISVELEFMYVLTYKEGYALLHHGAEKARLCRIVQRKFMEDHLGRWAPCFAELLAHRADAGYLRSVAALAEAFLTHELALLRARPDAVASRRLVEAPDPDEFACPLAQDCPVAEPGDQDASP